MHVRVNIDSCEQAIMGLELRAVSARVTKHFVTIFSKTCNNNSNNNFFVKLSLYNMVHLKHDPFLWTPNIALSWVKVLNFKNPEPQEIQVSKLASSLCLPNINNFQFNWSQLKLKINERCYYNWLKSASKS